MNTILFASDVNAWNLAGWTMIHFLWLGALVALFAFAGRWLLRRTPANIRYAFALACLSLLAALPIAIATWLHQNLPPSQVADSLWRAADSGGFVGATEQPPIAPIAAAPLNVNPPIDLA